ncbi:MAG: alanine racemase [Pseudomonadota bacterium]
MSRATCAEIDLGALTDNLETARRSAPGQPVLAVVKADAYGHGLVRAAEALHRAGVDALGVASLEEARTLRGAGIEGPVVLLEGFFEATELPALAELGLTPVIHCPWQLEALEAWRAPHPLPVWLKVDSGMHRLGFEPDGLPAVRERLARCPAVAGEPVVMTHLACADEPDRPETGRQLETFRTCVAADEVVSIANSAGILGWPEARRGWLRPGIMLYGVSPFAVGVENAAAGELRPVMTLRSELICVRRLAAGEAIGYGATWRAPEAMPVGVVAAGYGDGYPRHAPSGTPVLVGDHEVPLVGRVSMDMITVDLRAHPDACPGDPVTLWGRGLPVARIAEAAGTIGYELLCHVTPRVPRFCEGDSRV